MRINNRSRKSGSTALRGAQSALFRLSLRGLLRGPGRLRCEVLVFFAFFAGIPILLIG